MKKFLLIICIAIISFANAQDIQTTNTLETSNKYQFTTIIDIEASSVKNQDRTGTCWSFSASSFLESEIYRLSGKMINVSEMYTVRNTYPKKAWNYVMRQGKAQFSEGGLGHDVMSALKTGGLVPESEFSGLLNDATTHNHNQFIKDIKVVLDAYIKENINAEKPNWQEETSKILDENLGEKIEEFVFEGKVYTPQSFLEMTQINTNDYITITSFQHAPYYESFILNIPDNFAYGSFYNVPLDEFNAIAKQALKSGYSIEWDGDVSEKTFSSKYGIAIVPNDKENNIKALTEIVPEMEITADFREQEFNNYNTTDDHLMHITGMVADQNGNNYYKVKNSWGSNSNRVGNGGYVYMSETFFKLKSISIMVHKDAISETMREKLKI